MSDTRLVMFKIFYWVFDRAWYVFFTLLLINHQGNSDTWFILTMLCTLITFLTRKEYRTPLDQKQ